MDKYKQSNSKKEISTVHDKDGNAKTVYLDISKYEKIMDIDRMTEEEKKRYLYQTFGIGGDTSSK